MKKNINVSRNEANPPIPPKPNFNSLLENAGNISKPFFKQTWFWGAAGTAVVAVTALVVWLAGGNKNMVKTTVNDHKNDSIISVVKPLVKELDTKYDTFTVNVAKGDTLTYRGCTKIIVPPASISKSDGAAISQTKIVYREFQNQAEIMGSGIPMMYDSAGQKLLFESGGMFELRSVNADEKISSEKGVEVQMCSNHKQEGFNWYRLDEKNGQWAYIKPVVAQPKVQELKNKLQSDTAIIDKNQTGAMQPGAVEGWDISVTNVASIKTPVNPTPKPRMKSAKGYTFTVEEPNVPELALYKNVVFEVLPGQNFDPNKLPDEWLDIKVQKTSKNGVYQLSLIDAKRTLKFDAIPVFEDAADYQKALAAFQKNEKEYNEKLERDRKAEKLEAEKIIKDFTREQVNAKKRYATEPSDLNYGTMVMAFNVNSFGYFNSDRPIHHTSQNRQISYDIQGGGRTQGQLYQYYLNRNAVMVNYDLYGPGKTNLQYSENDKCLLIAILPEDKSIAILTPEEFEGQIVHGNAGSISLQKVDFQFKNTHDIQEFVMKNFGMIRKK